MNLDRKYEYGQNQKPEDIPSESLHELFDGRPNKLILIAGPNGAGKGTLLERVSNIPNNKTAKIVRHTTRPRGEFETDGVDYRFIDQKQFYDLIDSQELLEWSKYGQGYYGTSIEAIRAAPSLTQGPLITDIDVDGAIFLRNSLDSIGIPVESIFISPVAREVLMTEEGVVIALETLGQRMIGRDRGEASEELEGRLRWARKWLGRATTFDHVLHNGEIDKAVKDLLLILSIEA